MMKRVVRVLAAAAAAAACVTCADRVVTGVGGRGYARVPLEPVFLVAPPGGPSIDVETVQGVLKNGSDSVVASATVEGDSAVLEFENVVVHGDSSEYEISVEARDASGVLMFKGTEDIQVKPGDNPPATPDLVYAAPDTAVATVDITMVGIPVTSLSLNWAGGDTATSVNKICLSKSPSAGTSNTAQTVSVTGRTATNIAVTGVIRVGWTSTDTTVFTVDSGGTVRSRCANKTAKLIARTFLDKADTINVIVTAPPFSLLMSPDSASIRRGSTQTYTAIVVDELGNVAPATAVTFASSDTLRAKVNATTGVVTAVTNGRALITATATGTNPVRTTVGVAQVIRPLAATVVVQPAVPLDSLGRFQSRTYFAKALDAAGKVIPDASGFTWSSTNPSVVSVNGTSGLATTAAIVDSAKVIATLDGKADTISVQVLTALPPGSLKGKFTDAATGAPLSGVNLVALGGSTTSAADGSFTITGLQSGDDIVLSKSTYKTDTAFFVPAFPNKTLEVPTSSLSPIGGNGANVTGKVVNALTGSTVSGITVYAYTGINGGPTPKRPTVAPKASVTTNASGIYNFSGTSALPAGVYTLLVKGTGYSDGIGGANSVSGATYNAKDILIAPTAVGTGLFIILTWADCPATNVPCDLDAHLTGPTILPDAPGRFQVFHDNLRYLAGTDTIAALDVDDNNGRGPEIIGLRPAAAVGTYKFYVHNATAGTTPNKALADSASARVDVFQNAQLIGTFFPPPGVSGNVWNVFDYDGARLIPNGTITTEATPGVLSLRASSDKKKKQ